jgi:cytochrome c2
LFATHHFWKADQQCFVVRVSMLESTDSSFLTGSRPGLPWQTIFESSPCAPIEYPGKPPHFAGIQIGGRLAMLSDHELLVTIGDNELDGFNSPLSAPQDLTMSYGKTVLIDLQDFSSRFFSIGHRNPQGLYAAQSGAIWETEHGPQGGDELNLLVRDANYGWPLVTYGVEYGTHSWAFDAVPGTHDHFTEPFYSWIPSIGVSSLLVSNSPLFKLWSGDLLVSSLKDQAIYRVRIRGSRIVMMERIPIGGRIRDINEGRDGELLLWTDGGSVLVVRIDTDVGAGEAAFHVCSGCHAIDWEHHGIGPDLFHVVNRKVATMENFKYSPAMRSLGGKWTPERLDAFIKNPQGYVPGTAMRFPGEPDADARAKIISYLSSSANRVPKQRLRP